MVYSQLRSPKGFMQYSMGHCDLCGTYFIGRYRTIMVLTWERCRVCDALGDDSGFPMLTIDWDDYVGYMENGATLLYDE